MDKNNNVNLITSNSIENNKKVHVGFEQEQENIKINKSNSLLSRSFMDFLSLYTVFGGDIIPENNETEEEEDDEKEEEEEQSNEQTLLINNSIKNKISSKKVFNFKF